MPISPATLTLSASLAILVRVWTSWQVEGWGAGGLALVLAAACAFALHAWILVTGRIGPIALRRQPMPSPGRP